MNDAVWAYCVASAGDALPEMPGVHADHATERVEEKGLAVLVSQVPLDEFGEEPLQRNLNDLGWLQRVALAHEAVLERALAGTTIVPLRLCTIFADHDAVRRMVAERRDALTTALDALAGREEWAVKLLVDRSVLEASVRGDDGPQGGESTGTAYLTRRRAEREVGERAGQLAVRVAEDVHTRLQDWATAAVLNAPQNRELSGHEGEMLLNGAYLVERDRASQLPQIVDELTERHRELGARIELSGPLPPFNFLPAT